VDDAAERELETRLGEINERLDRLVAAGSPAGGRATNTPLATVTAVFGLFAGLASLLAILGGLALTVRFLSTGLPTHAIVAGIPPRFFLTVGLDVTLQLVIFVALVALAILASGVSRLVLVVLAAGLLAYPLTRTVSGTDWIWLGVVALLTALGVWLRVRRLAKKLDGKTNRWSRLLGLAATLGGGFAVLVTFAVWRFAFEWRAVDVREAKACIAGDQEEYGLFIGENDNSVFIGVTSPGPARIVEIPRDDVKRIFISKSAEDITCPPSPPPPPAPPSTPSSNPPAPPAPPSSP
jgi:hypothetical protein